MNNALTWVRANVLIVIFGLLALLAVIGLPLVASSRNAYVTEEMNRRIQILRELENLERTQVSLSVGGLGSTEVVQIDQRAVVNATLLSRLRTVSEAQASDAREIYVAAEQFNRSNHSILMPDLFPEPRIGRELWGRRFHRIMEQAYESLLQDVRAGMPPSAELLVADLERRRRQFLTATLQKDDGDDLTAEESERLAEVLSQARIALLARAAEDVAFYCPADLMPLPPFDQARQYTQEELFQWQWEYWVISDVLHALADANRAGAGGSVLRGPVKRVVSMQPFVRLEAPASGGGGAPGVGGTGFGGDPSGGGFGGGTEEVPAGPSGTPPNPDTPVQVDYRSRFTGRSTNSLYDIVDVRLELVVDTARIPQVIDAFSQRNFMTVVDFRMRSDDPLEAVRNGFVYGSPPVARVEILLETVWLRSWTVAMMPEPVRTALGAALPPAPGAQAEDDVY